MKGKDIISELRGFGLSLKEISNLTGLSYGGVKKLSRGERQGSQSSLARLGGLLADVKEMAQVLPSMQGAGGGKGGRRGRVASASSSGGDGKKRKGKGKGKKKKEIILFKSVRMKVLVDYLVKINEDDPSSACYRIEVAIINFFDRVKKAIRNDNSVKYIAHSKIYTEQGEANVTMTRYFTKKDFFTDELSFIKESENNICQLVNALAGSKKKIKAIRMRLLGYVEKIKNKKERKNARKK